MAYEVVKTVTYLAQASISLLATIIIDKFCFLPALEDYCKAAGDVELADLTSEEKKRMRNTLKVHVPDILCTCVYKM